MNKPLDPETNVLRTLLVDAPPEVIWKALTDPDITRLYTSTDISLGLKAGQPVQEGMLNRVEAAVRAHDPCLSCSTHAVGQMPIIIDVLDQAGNVTQTIRRD